MPSREKLLTDDVTPDGTPEDDFSVFSPSKLPEPDDSPTGKMLRQALEQERLKAMGGGSSSSTKSAQELWKIAGGQGDFGEFGSEMMDFENKHGVSMPRLNFGNDPEAEKYATECLKRIKGGGAGNVKAMGGSAVPKELAFNHLPDSEKIAKRIAEKRRKEAEEAKSGKKKDEYTKAVKGGFLNKAAAKKPAAGSPKKGAASPKKGAAPGAAAELSPKKRQDALKLNLQAEHGVSPKKEAGSVTGEEDGSEIGPNGISKAETQQLASEFGDYMRNKLHASENMMRENQEMQGNQAFSDILTDAAHFKAHEIEFKRKAFHTAPDFMKNTLINEEDEKEPLIRDISSEEAEWVTGQSGTDLECMRGRDENTVKSIKERKAAKELGINLESDPESSEYTGGMDGSTAITLHHYQAQMRQQRRGILQIRSLWHDDKLEECQRWKSAGNLMVSFGDYVKARGLYERIIAVYYYFTDEYGDEKRPLKKDWREGDQKVRSLRSPWFDDHVT